jgi:DNA-binding GntR family transcriptional regulator
MYTNIHEASGPAHSAEWTVYAYVRGEILSGRLAGGSPIRQEEIAARLGVSRIPVRDALRHLAADGLVTFESNRRVVVTVLRDADLMELFEMRAVLEGLAARHAIVKLTDADFDQLTWLAERMDRTERAGDQWVPIHHEFHALLCGRSGMPRLVREVTRLRQGVEPYVRVLITLHGAAEMRASRHRNLVKSLRNLDRDPDRAEKVVRDHILQAKQEILAIIRTSKLGRTTGSAVADTGSKGGIKKAAPNPFN